MAIFEGPYQSITDYTTSDWENLRLAVDYDPYTGKVGEYEPKKLNKRSRGRHEPGSAPYWNRWVFGDAAFFEASNGKRYFLGGTFECEFYKPGNDGFWKNGAPYRYFWDGHHFVNVAVGVTNWAGVTGGQWAVQYTVSFFEDYGFSWRWWQLLGARDGHVGVTKFERRYFGNADDNAAKQAAYDYFEYIWNKFQTAQAFEYPDREQSFAGWELSGHVVMRDPQFSEEVEGVTLRIEEGDPSFHSIHRLCANAYMSAVNNLPSLVHQNNIANILDILHALRSFRDGYKAIASAKKLAQEAWLAYRYAYGTTRADVQEVADLLGRLSDLLRVTTLTSHGQDWSMDGWRCQCTLKISMDEFNGLLSKVEKWGLQLNSYNMWDLVPYSFMIDWFADIGGWLEFGEARKIAYRVSPSDIWYSLERKWTNEFGFKEIYYHRFRWDMHLSQATYVSRDASGVTIVKRALDALAIFS